MGLAKKLAPIIKNGDSIANVDFQWSTQSYTLKEIISKFKLPCVVQCSVDSCSVLWSKFKFDLKQPLLLYSVRTVSKIYARTVKPSKTGDDFIEFGPPLVIPEDYEGWFGPVSSEASTLTRHTRVEDVAEAESDFFLVATKVPVFSLNGGESTGVYSQHYVYPGQVLRKDGFINGPLDASSQANFAAKDKHHLKCVDNKAEEFVIPFSHRGLFYEVSKVISDDATGVFNTDQIMDTGGSRFPIILRHIQGDLPALNYSFTGTIQCNHIFSEQTIVACSIGLDSNAPTPLELECKSKIKFTIALNELDFKATNEYQRALDYCNHQSEQYAKSIKVSFTLKPEISTLEELDLSLYDTGSDTGDVDAQSEFDIDWGPDSSDSIEALENLIKAKRSVSSPLSCWDNQPEANDSVDMGASFELPNPNETVYKKAAAYTASLESQGSTVGDVTVDSSLLGDSFMDKSIDVTDASMNNTANSFEDSSADTLDTNGADITLDSVDSEIQTIPVLPESEKNLEFIGNLSKTLPGRLLKEEATRTSSGVDEINSTKKLNEDWGPEIAPVTNGLSPVLNDVHDEELTDALPVEDSSEHVDGETLSEMVGETNAVIGQETQYDQMDTTSSTDSDSEDRCVVDLDKDTSGKLTSYRSLNSLNKIGPGGEIDAGELEQLNNINNNNSDVESESNPLNNSFGSNSSMADSTPAANGLNDSVSESEFIFTTGHGHDTHSKSDSSDFLEEVRDQLDLDWDKSDDSNDTVINKDHKINGTNHDTPQETVINRKSKLKRLVPLRSKRSVLDMSLDEAVV